ncbi:hypothetical protein ACFE04_002404 [Oxalis oulophora]
MENHNTNHHYNNNNVINTNNTNITCSLSSSSAFNLHHHAHHHSVPHPPPADDISTFLRQILNRSSAVPETPPGLLRPHTISFDGGATGYLPSGGYAGESLPVAQVTSSPVRGSDNHDTDEYDCESEEGLDPLMEEPLKPMPPRGSSKRTRAAEVHNLSEKRRRSRINEKMKALQNLIPNSNKTDKASMLDEAIEYLKQLQLQVQMLTMRNGLNLHSMGLPGILHPIQLPFPRMNFAEENESSHINMTNPLQEASSQDHPYMPVMPNISGLSTSFVMESSVVPARFGYQLHPSSEEICGEGSLPRQQPNVNLPEVNRSAEVSVAFNDVASVPKKGSLLGASIIGREEHRTKRSLQ